MKVSHGHGGGLTSSYVLFSLCLHFVRASGPLFSPSYLFLYLLAKGDSDDNSHALDKWVLWWARQKAPGKVFLRNWWYKERMFFACTTKYVSFSAISREIFRKVSYTLIVFREMNTKIFNVLSKLPFLLGNVAKALFICHVTFFEKHVLLGCLWTRASLAPSFIRL